MSDCKDCGSKRDHFDEYNNPDWTCPKGCDEKSRDPLSPEEVALELQDFVDNVPCSQITDLTETLDYYGQGDQDDDMALGPQRTIESPIYIEQTSKTDQNLLSTKFENEINKHVDDILNSVEEIIKQVDSVTKRVNSPIQMPSYPKKMEQGLSLLAKDEVSFSNFSNHIYMLFIDGHQRLMNQDRSLIKKSEFLNFGSSLYNEIYLFRNVLHHENMSETKKIELGKLYKKICGKSVLDDPDSRIKFQIEILKRTANCLKTELDVVKIKVDQLAA
jgi:hypothetical protein